MTRGVLMTSLPSIDLGLMAEHLSAHEGEINKLELYQRKVINTDLKSIINLQANIMRDHVRVMLALINPHQNGQVELNPINMGHYTYMGEKQTNAQDKWIAIEAHTTAQNMSNENFFSALMMKDQHVRKIHVQMALQQLELQGKYSEFIKRNGWGFTPYASVHEQLGTLQHYQHVFSQL